MIDRCPRENCDAPLEATVVRYLADVKLDDDGQIVSYEVWSGNDSDGYSWDHDAVRVYCKNDHEVPDWQAPKGVVPGL